MQDIQLEFNVNGNRKKTLIYASADDCRISRFNTRKTRDEDDIRALAQRIERNGFEVTRALWVYEDNGKYEVFAGGNRLEAVRLTSYKDNVPLLLHEGYSDKEIAQLESQDNANDEYHKEVPIVDVWAEYARLRDEEGWKQQEIADAKGISRTRVATAISLNDNLPDEIKSIVRQGDITQGHCEELLRLSVDGHFSDWLTEEQLWINLANMTVEKKLSVSKLKTQIDYWKKRIEVAEENYQKFEEEVVIGDNTYHPRTLYVERLAKIEASTQKECNDTYSEIQSLIQELQEDYEQWLKEQADEAARKARKAKEEKLRIKLLQQYEPKIYMESFDADRLEDNSVKMVITSPEYYSPKVWQHETSLDELVKEQVSLFVSMKPKLKEDAVLCINVNDLRDQNGMLYPYSLKIACQMIENGFYLRDEIIWNKVARPPANSENNLTDYKEFIFVFTINTATGVNIEAINDKDVTDRGNMWIISADERTDDTDLFPFPEKLVEYCLLYGSEEDDLILEPYLGTGTTCAVCKRMKRRSIGFERNSELEDTIKEKIDTVKIKIKKRSEV